MLDYIIYAIISRVSYDHDYHNFVFCRLDWKKLKLTFQESMPSVEITSDYKLNSRIFVIFLEIEGHCRIMLRKYHKIVFLQIKFFYYLLSRYILSCLTNPQYSINKIQK